MYQSISVNKERPGLGGLRVYLSSKDDEDNTITHNVWRLNNHQSNKWRIARVQLGEKRGQTRVSPARPYSIVFEGIWANSKDGLIAIDDVSFLTGVCKSE